MNAKAFLKQVEKLDCMIENKRAERERWLELAVSTTAGAAPDTGVRVQSSGSKQRMADAVIRSVDIGSQIDIIIGKLFETRQQIISVIETLPTDEYNLLHKMYVGEIVTNEKTGKKERVYLSLKDAADKMDKSYSTVRGLHGTALQHVQTAINTQCIAPLGEPPMEQRFRIEEQ